MGQDNVKRNTKYTGVRYRQHPTRKTRNNQQDRYFTIRYRRDGKLVEERVGWASDGWTAEKAHFILVEIKRNILTGSGPRSLAEIKSESEQAARESEEARITSEIESLTVERYFTDYYLPHSQITKRSWRSDASRFKTHILPALGNIPLALLQRENIQEMADNLLAQGRATSSVKHAIALLGRSLNVAPHIMPQGRPVFTGKNPASSINLPKLVNARERYLMPEEANRLMAAARKLPALDLHDAIILSLYAGLRRGEIFRLRWPDIHLDHATLNVCEEDRRKPGGKVPLSDFCLRMLIARKERSVSHTLLFPACADASRQYALIAKFSQIIDELGLNDGIDKTDRQRRVVFHTLRHTFASWLAINGTDIYRIKTLMRHKTIDMTMRYAHLIPDATRLAVDLLPIPDCENL